MFSHTDYCTDSTAVSISQVQDPEEQVTGQASGATSHAEAPHILLSLKFGLNRCGSHMTTNADAVGFNSPPRHVQQSAVRGAWA